MRIFATVITVIGTAALAVVLFAAGFFVCAAPPTTQLLSQATSDFQRSPYTLDDLNTLAVASRNLTVDARPAGTSSSDAQRTFNETLMLAATHSCERYTKEGAEAEAGSVDKPALWKELLASLGAANAGDAFTLQEVNATAEAMARHSDAFALDDNAVSHLDDCNKLIQGGILVVEVLAVVFLVCLVALLVLRQKRALGRMMSIAPVVLIAAFVAMGVWAFTDFRGFFAAFHGVFFPQGNWTFSYESLLICMYPTAFWMGMGIVWLTVTLAASIIALVIGVKVLRRAR